MNTDTVTRRVLIFRLGSLGDTLVALPSLRLVARHYPNAERRVLTNFAVSERAPPMADILDGTGLVHGYFRFPPRDLGLRGLLALAREVRAWAPQVVLYLHEARGPHIALRDALFFRLCGIRRRIGIPFAPGAVRPPYDHESGLYEHKAVTIARRLATLGDARLGDTESWDLRLSAAEQDAADALLAPLKNCAGILAVSIGCKVDVKDWEDPNWRALLATLAPALPGWGVVWLGAPSEAARSDALAKLWGAASLNLCGRTGVRVSAAVLRRARFYVGHDSGPMHLAAAVGTPCVAIFSARNFPGEWYPYGDRHAVFYRQTECFGCRLDTCVAHAKKCILSIRPEEVAEAALRLAARGAAAAPV